jgi:hypothetical protein
VVRKKSQNEKNNTINDVVNRLDAIIRLLIEANDKNEKFSKTNIIPVLDGVGIDPIDIAKIYGKKKASDISPFLYKKKKDVGSK